MEHGIPYFDAREHAENLGADLALMVHEYCIVDADRCILPLILDEDGVIWHSNSPNSVDSITLDAMRSSLLAAGYHIQTGKLNERLIARCVKLLRWVAELVFLGLIPLTVSQLVMRVPGFFDLVCINSSNEVQ